MGGPGSRFAPNVFIKTERNLPGKSGAGGQKLPHPPPSQGFPQLENVAGKPPELPYNRDSERPCLDPIRNPETLRADAGGGFAAVMADLLVCLLPNPVSNYIRQEIYRKAEVVICQLLSRPESIPRSPPRHLRP